MRLSASYSYVIVMISVWCHRRCSAFVVSYSKRSQYFSSLLGSRVINNRNPWSLLQDSLHTDTDREAVEYSLFTQDATFNSIGVNEKLIDALSLAGFSKATHIQAMAFDPVMSGKDVMIGSETGSGKTLAYLLPLMHGLLSRTEEEIEKNEKEFPSAAIVVPNKQLANQVFTMTKAITAGLQTTLTVETG